MKKNGDALMLDQARVDLVSNVCRRYAELYRVAKGKSMGKGILARAMATLYFAKDHGTGALIDLAAMFAESDIDLMRDFIGAVTYFNPLTHTFKCNFVPKCGFSQGKCSKAE